MKFNFSSAIMGKSSRGVKSTFNPNNFSSLALVSQNRKTPGNKVKHDNTKKVAAVRQRRKFCDFIVISITSLIVVAIAIFVTYQRMLNEPSNLMTPNCNKLVVLIHSNETSKIINQVFETLDYVIVHEPNENWNILWSTHDPFELFSNHMPKLKPHQLVNHINRSMLVAPRAFQLPQMKQDLMNYETENPQTRFIVKDCMFDRAKVDIDNVDISYDSNFAVHEFFSGNSLINDYRFYFGVFFLVSSVEPLRVYRYKGDVMARFAHKSRENGKFLCQELLSTLEIPLLKKYSGYSSKHAVEGYLRENGHNVTKLYETIDEAFVKFLVSKLRNVKKSSNNFIQLMRVDFNVDAEMNAEIIDVETKVDYEGYEGMLYDVLRLIGASNPYEFKSRSSLECPMLSSLKDIAVTANSCFNFPCNESCSSLECELCLSCLKQVPVSHLNHLHRSYREQMRCGSNMKRIFPKHYDDSLVNQLSLLERLISRWFQAKCDAEGGEWC